MRKLHTRFGLISVSGTQAVDLERRLILGERVEVTIKGVFQSGRAWGRHDGTDQEFALDIKEATFDDDNV